MRRIEPFAVLSAGLLTTPPNGEVLLLETSYKEPWEIPGGFVEPTESLAGARYVERGSP